MPGCVINNASRLGASLQRVVAMSLTAIMLLAGAGSAIAHEAHGHPARIHEGTCENLGAVTFRLNGVGGSVDLDNAPVPTPTAVNPDQAYQVMVSETTIDSTLDDILAAEHAIMVYESDEAMDAIACGPIGGAMSGDTLITGLAEVGVPGHLGFALLQPEGDRLNVSLIIGHAMAPVSASGAPAEHEHDEEVASHDEPDEEEAHDTAATQEA